MSQTELSLQSLSVLPLDKRGDLYVSSLQVWLALCRNLAAAVAAEVQASRSVLVCPMPAA